MKSTSGRFLSFLAGLVLVFGICDLDEALAYSIVYQYYANATNSSVPLSGEGILYEQPELYDEQTVHGDPAADHYATLRYFADLPAGSLGSYTYSEGDVTAFYPYGFEATARVDQISFAIRLEFTVPAGEYPVGVDVSISGRADGDLWSEIDSGAQIQYEVTFGYDSVRSPLMQIGTYESGSIEFHEPFDLVTRIVSPGIVLPAPQVFSVTLNAAVTNNWTWTVLSGTPPDYHAGNAEADLYSALRFTQVTVPTGVTWDSEDHVFLSDVTGVHEGSTPRASNLEQNTPNPFNPVTTISFALTEPSPVRLAVYDDRGRQIRVLIQGVLDGGRHRITWDGKDGNGRNVASGVYSYRLESRELSRSRKMTLVR